MPQESVHALEYGIPVDRRTRLRTFVHGVLFLNATLLGAHWITRKIQFAQDDPYNAWGTVKAVLMLSFAATCLIAAVTTLILHATGRRRLSVLAYIWLALTVTYLVRESYLVLRFVYP